MKLNWVDKIFICNLIFWIWVIGFLCGGIYESKKPGKTIIFKEECIIKKPSKQADVYVTRL